MSAQLEGACIWCEHGKRETVFPRKYLPHDNSNLSDISISMVNGNQVYLEPMVLFKAQTLMIQTKLGQTELKKSTESESVDKWGVNTCAQVL